MHVGVYELEGIKMNIIYVYGRVKGKGEHAHII